MNRAFSLFAYRLILRSHPTSFLDRFGDEMLWIFEEECQRGATVRVLFDGILSLLRQRFPVQNESVQSSTSYVLISDSRISAFRLLQGGLMSTMLWLGVIQLLGHGRPLPVPFRPLRPPECMPGSLPIQVPSQIEALRDTLR